MFMGKNGGEEERGAEEEGKVGGEGGEGTSNCFIVLQQQAPTSRTMASSLLKR